MKFLCYIDRVNRMNRLLQRRATGNPSEFARQLGVSRSRLYEMLDELRSYGAPIAYSKTVRTFYYEEPFEIQVSFSVKALDAEETIFHTGGTAFLSAYFFSGRCLSTFTKRNVTCC